jgi:hypothetical protein
MSENVFILGETGSGKSTAIRNLPAKETAIINMCGKTLPFRGNKDFGIINTYDYEKITQAISRLETNDKIKYVVFDDFQYLMSFMWMGSLLEPKTKDSEFVKYKEIGFVVWDILTKAQSMKGDKINFFLSHNTVDETGRSKAKTIGRLLDDKVTLEGLFTVVLNTAIHIDRPMEERYVFQVHNNGNNTSKSPMGMFSEDEIPNDLLLVANTINKYNGKGA